VKRIPFALIVVVAIAACSDGSQNDVSYTIVTSANHDCAKGPNASIDSNDAAFKLTSTCERILIKGGNNRITIEAAKRIDVDGTKNNIEVSAADIIRINGVGNTVKFKKKAVTKKAQDVVAIGDNNSPIQMSD
jgi:uncharacterized protein (DUF2345 family)